MGKLPIVKISRRKAFIRRTQSRSFRKCISLEVALSKSKNENRDLSIQVEGLKSRVREQSNEIRDLESSASSARSDLYNSQTSLELQSEDIKQMGDDISYMDREMQRMRDHIRSLECECRQKDMNIIKMEDQICNMRDMIHGLEEEDRSNKKAIEILRDNTMISEAISTNLEKRLLIEESKIAKITNEGEQEMRKLKKSLSENHKLLDSQASYIIKNSILFIAARPKAESVLELRKIEIGELERIGIYGFINLVTGPDKKPDGRYVAYSGNKENAISLAKKIRCCDCVSHVSVYGNYTISNRCMVCTRKVLVSAIDVIGTKRAEALIMSIIDKEMRKITSDDFMEVFHRKTLTKIWYDTDVKLPSAADERLYAASLCRSMKEIPLMESDGMRYATMAIATVIKEPSGKK